VDHALRDIIHSSFRSIAKPLLYLSFIMVLKVGEVLSNEALKRLTARVSDERLFLKRTFLR
jgi:hypothetical protein